MDEEAEISCALGTAKLREEVWQDSTGGVVRYNLAFINHLLYNGDNGRVLLGYDLAHGYHHRHFLGQTQQIEFNGYEEVSERFLKEVAVLRRRKRV